MYWTDNHKETLKKLKKVIIIASLVITAVILLSVLQYAVHYYSNPMEEEIDILTTGCLIFDMDKGLYELVHVEMRGKNLHYLFHNKEDGIQGDIWVNGYSIFGNDRNKDGLTIGFYSEFHQDSSYAYAKMGIGNNTLCENIAVSKDQSTVICSISVDSNILDSMEPKSKVSALLVLPADDLNTARSLVREAAFNSRNMENWLIDYGYFIE